MPNKKFKSSYHPGDSDRIDPDSWLTSQDRTKMTQVICPPRGEDDPRYIETILWIDSEPVDRFFVTIIDEQTGRSVTTYDEYLTNAEYQAKVQIGIPIPVTP